MKGAIETLRSVTGRVRVRLPYEPDLATTFEPLSVSITSSALCGSLLLSTGGMMLAHQRHYAKESKCRWSGKPLQRLISVTWSS